MSRAVTMAPRKKVEIAHSNGVIMRDRRCGVEMVLSLADITTLAPKCRTEMAYSCIARKLLRQRREGVETRRLQQAPQRRKI